MFSKPQVASVLLALFVTASVNAHGAIVAAAGGNGVTGQAFGIVDSTPRDGTKRNPFQADTSIIRDKEIASGDAQPCGRTLAGGVNYMAAQLATSSAGLPSVGSDGSVTMTAHQINGDGAGPYTRDTSADASGQKFVAMEVTTNVPGQNSRSKAKATDFSLVAQMPADMTCTGGPDGSACIVRCRNAAAAGPFDGCIVFMNAAPAGGNSMTTTPKRDVTIAEAEEALREVMERRSAKAEKKRYLRTRIAGAKAGYWI
ncbi:unnamed protein product [Rhizoctonia solani]|uniref:GEgh 16 protein n=1 Tax=Rhizoctonia solani TaxID=456999 RepID=A0A8H3HDZ7_9AGAM|nr:unnamed protein product [Rhizoctonia solani]CAE6504355.1 unnamed protein product [Rhizoctonia solani]